MLRTDLAHLRRAGIANMRVVGPHHRLGSGAMMIDQSLQCLGHVLVAQVPGLGRAPIHGTVVFFGPCNDAGVLLGIEVARPVTQIALHVREPVLQQVDEHT